MRNETDRTDRRIQNGSGYFRSRVKRECPTKANLGTDGETRTAVVSDLAKDGESFPWGGYKG